MPRFTRFKFGRRSHKPRLLHGIHPVPTMVTLGNLICGFGAIILSLKAGVLAAQNAALSVPNESGLQKPEDCLYFAGLLIFAAMIFDVLDGSVARLTKSTSKFGMEMDSLCDVVSFGVAPAVLVKTLLDCQTGKGAVDPLLDRYLIPLLVIYVSCAALRLARYNVESETVHRNFFFGMPSPGAAGCAASLVIMSLPATHHWGISPLHAQVDRIESYLSDLRRPILVAMPFVMLGLGVLMVSRVHYQHVGDKILKGKKSFMHLLVLGIALALVIMHHEIMLAAAFNGYMLFGLANELRFQFFPKHRPPEWSTPEEANAETQPADETALEKTDVPK